MSFLLTRLRLMRLACLSLLLFAAASAAAQTPADSTRAPEARPALIPFGQAVTYSALLKEYSRLRRIPPENPTDSLSSPDPFLGIQGLVVDETVTPSGRYFYEVYFQLWVPPPGAERVTVSVSEQPLPGSGTALIIKADGELLLQTRLPRRPEEIEDLARQAVSFIQSRLVVG